MAFTLDIADEVRAAIAAAPPELRRDLIEAVREAVSDRLIGVEEAAELLGITRAAMRRRVSRGQAGAVRIGRSVRLRLSELLR